MDLTKLDLTGVQLITFSGVSGSGKTTSLRRLVSGHPEFRFEPRTELLGSPLRWRDGAPQTRLVVIDELIGWRDYWPLVRLLRRGHRVIAASHLPEYSLRLLACRWRALMIRVDGDYRAISRFLQQSRVRHSDAAVRSFCSVLGASYVDAGIVLERYPHCSFDEAWTRFERTTRISREPARSPGLAPD